MKILLLNNVVSVLPRWLRQIFLVMRITTLILLTALLQVSASSLAQKISIDKKNASIQTILNEISKQSGYDFFYDANALKKIKPISVVIKNADLDDAVRKSLEGLPLSYSIDSKTVIIKEAKPSFLDRIIDRFAAVDVRGRVLDEAGNPLVGATIQVKGKAQAYKTKENGEFEIKGVDDDAVLLVSYVGFKTLEIALKDAVMPLEIRLNVATGELEEVKVVYNTGYQELNKERSTGSFVQIDNELFNRQVGTNVLDRILNVTSGLLASPVASNPSAGSIVVRGFSTINADKNALIVVDNFPYEGDLSTLNPNDFWASWCKPCRAETPNMRRVYDAFHDKGFNIIGVSSDAKEGDWKKAIAEDNTLWLHGWDNLDRATKGIFSIGAIPAFALADEEGKLIAFSCGMSKIPSFGPPIRGEELYKTIETLLKEKTK